MSSRAPSKTKLAFWDDFCREHRVLEKAVPLFALSNSVVSVRNVGKNSRPVLRRSPEMEALVISETKKVLLDYETAAGEYEGLIYMMLWRGGRRVIPLYIGKSEKYGRKSGNLSANIARIEKNNHKFCRWGDNYRYHVGDLSAVVCPGHPKQDKKYLKWAERLFASWDGPGPKLRRETLFWMEAWRRGGSGPWKEYGETSLTFLEYQLIGVASDLFADVLLNEEGVNRC